MVSRYWYLKTLLIITLIILINDNAGVEIFMNLIQNNMSFGSGYTPSAYNYERSVKLNNKLHANVKIPGGNQASESYITTGTASNDLRGLSISSYSIDNAIGLVKSIDATAEVIEKS